MRIVVHRDIPDDPQLRKQWNALVQAMDCPEVFYTHEWALAARRAFGDSLLPLLVLAYDAEKLAGVAALATDPARKTVNFLGSTSADYCDLLSRPDQRDELLDAVLAELCLSGLQNLVLTSIPAESATMKALRSAARKYGYRLFVRPTAVCAPVDLRSKVERAELKTALAKKKIFRHSMNAFGREGFVSFSHLVTWDAIEPALSSFGVAHVARFLSLGRISNIVSAQRRVFLSELARLLSESGWLVLSQMLVEDRPIAWNYGFQFQGSWFWYLPTFDTSYERLSPGYCLLSKMISEACDNAGMRVVDLGLGAEGYKERFANNSRSTQHASLTKSSAQHASEIIRYGAARALKSVPAAESAVRAILGGVDCTRERFREGGMQALAAQSVKQMTSWINRREEVVFYEWRDDARSQEQAILDERLILQSVDLNTFAVAAISYENEPETLSYLLRAARRLQLKTGQGFALIDREDTPVHLCWIDDFEGFEMRELKTPLSAPSQHAALIIDCWTPQSKRGRGYFGIALSLVARNAARSGKEPWTFCVATNHSSRRSIESAGFGSRYSVICNKTMA